MLEQPVVSERRYWTLAMVLALLPLVSVGAYLGGNRAWAAAAAVAVVLASVALATRAFMHVNAEPPFVTYLVLLVVAFVALFFFLVAPDVMRHSGQRWINEAGAAHDHHPGHAGRVKGH